MSTILQLSDLHVEPAGVLAYGHEDTAGRLDALTRHALAFAKETGAHAVVVTGDVACDGNEEAYARVADAFSIFKAEGIPVYMIPGNHDRRGNFSRILAEFIGPKLVEEGERLDQVIALEGDRLILLDTLQPGLHWGGLPEEVLLRLKRLLDDPAPALVFTHHTPMHCGMGKMDEPFANREAFLSILNRRPDVRLATGHMHRAIVQVWGGTVVTTAPSTALAIPVELTPEGGDAFRLEPPGWALHHRRANGWNTFFGHFAVPSSYAGPYPFKGAVNPID